MKAAGIRRIALTVAIIAALALLSVTLIGDRTLVGAQQPASQPKTAEQRFKNIQVVKNMPASELQSSMSFMAASLGVDCSYCHTPPAMEKDDKPAKATARRMLVMMNEINKNFGDQIAVNCATCHRGQTKPAAIPPLPPLLTASSVTTSPAPLPTVDEVLQKYFQALGGESALNKVRTRLRKGLVQISGGPSGTFESYEAAPSKSLLTGSLPAPLGSVHQGFDGTIGWVKNQSGVFEMSGDGLAQAKREANFYADTRLREQFTGMTVTKRDRVDGREVYVIEGTRAEGTWERFLFDVQSGFLLRRYWETPTFLGRIPNGTDYDNYRRVGSVRLPFLIRRSRPGRTFLQNISDIKLNVAIDDSKFNKPPAQK